MAEKDNPSMGERIWAGVKSAVIWGVVFVGVDLIIGKVFKLKMTSWDWKTNVAIGAGIGVWDAATLKPKDKTAEPAPAKLDEAATPEKKIKFQEKVVENRESSNQSKVR